METRKKHAYGECTDYFHSRNCIGFVRAGDASHGGCAVLVSNAPPGARYVSLAFSGVAVVLIASCSAKGTVHSVRMNVGAVRAFQP